MKTEEALVRSAQGGCQDSLGALVERHYGPLHRYVARLTRRRAGSEDLTQEVFTRAIAALPRFNGEYRVEPWLRRIARNLLVDQARERSHRHHPEPMDPQELPKHESAPHVDVVWESVRQRDTASTVQEALTQLPSRERTALVLRSWKAGLVGR